MTMITEAQFYEAYKDIVELEAKPHPLDPVDARHLQILKNLMAEYEAALEGKV